MRIGLLWETPRNVSLLASNFGVGKAAFARFSARRWSRSIVSKGHEDGDSQEQQWNFQAKAEGAAPPLGPILGPATPRLQHRGGRPDPRPAGGAFTAWPGLAGRVGRECRMYPHRSLPLV